MSYTPEYLRDLLMPGVLGVAAGDVDLLAGMLEQLDTAWLTYFSENWPEAKIAVIPVLTAFKAGYRCRTPR